MLLATEALLPILGWLFPVEPLLRGWLIAFAIFSCVPIGSMTWLIIHRLTGGEWGRAAAPVLRPAAAMCPLLIFSFVPVLAGIRHIYPWAADPAAIPADVAHWYLNGLSFLVRAAIALLGWSLLALCFAAGLGSRLLAGLGLAFFGLSISLVAVDWYLSLEPHYVATAFAATIAIQQLLAALAVAALISPSAMDGKTAGDIGGLLIATLLGVVYLEFMTFVVGWYGDLPDKVEWFLKRAGTGWLGILGRGADSRGSPAVRHADDTDGSLQPFRLARHLRAHTSWYDAALCLVAGAGLRRSGRRCRGCLRRRCSAVVRFPPDSTGACPAAGGPSCRMRRWAAEHCRRRQTSRPGS